MKKTITENLARIRDNIAEACVVARRDPAEVQIIAVVKTVEVDTVLTLIDMAQLDLGESRVQELMQKQATASESLRRRGELTGGSEEVVAPSLRWHMIGHLQRNKVRQLLPVVESIHSVDSLRLAEEINTAAAKLGLSDKVKILLQVNTSQERQKHGLAVGAVTALAEQIETLPNLQAVGLMTMAPLTNDADLQRFCFGRLRELFEEIRGKNICGSYFRHLSMGMSGDYRVAVEQGATLLRIGTALFE